MSERRTETAAVEHPLTAAESARVDLVMTQHRRFIESVAAQHAPDQASVPDIVQQVALTLCRRLHTFQGRSRLSTWLVRVTINEARMAHRRRQRRDGYEASWHHMRIDGINPAAAATAHGNYLRPNRLAASHRATGGMTRSPRLVRRPRPRD